MAAPPVRDPFAKVNVVLQKLGPKPECLDRRRSANIHLMTCYPPDKSDKFKANSTEVEVRVKLRLDHAHPGEPADIVTLKHSNQGDLKNLEVAIVTTKTPRSDYELKIVWKRVSPDLHVPLRCSPAGLQRHTRNVPRTDPKTPNSSRSSGAPPENVTPLKEVKTTITAKKKQQVHPQGPRCEVTCPKYDVGPPQPESVPATRQSPTFGRTSEMLLDGALFERIVSIPSSIQRSITSFFVDAPRRAQGRAALMSDAAFAVVFAIFVAALILDIIELF